MIKLKGFLRNYWGVLCTAFVCAGIAAYFGNLIFLQNKDTVLSVLVLSEEVDRDKLEEEIRQVIKVGKGEEITIQTVEYDNNLNQGAVLTWIRSGTIDLMIGNETQMTIYGQYGYLRNLEETGFETEKKKFFCGKASFDEEGKILAVQGEDWVGVYSNPIVGAADLGSPIAAMTANVKNEESAITVLEKFTE